MCRVFSCVLLFILLSFSSVVSAQKSLKDSLQLILKNYELQKDYELDTNYLSILNKYAYSYWSSNPDTVIILSEQAYHLSEKAGYSKGAIRALTNVAIGHSQKGNDYEALRIGDKAAEYSINAGDEASLCVVYQNMSLSYRSLGKYAESMELTVKALALAQKHKLSDKIAHNYFNLAVLYVDLGNNTEAQKNFDKAIEINKTLNNQELQAWIYLNTAMFKAGEKDFKESELLLTEALNINTRLGSPKGICVTKEAFGRMLLLANKPKEALDYFLESKKMQEKIEGNSYTNLNTLLLSIAQCYEQLEQYPASLAVAQELLGTDNFDLKRYAQHLISSIYKKQGKYKEALLHYEQYKLYSDSVNEENSGKQIVRIEEQHKYNQKEAELKAQHATQKQEQRIWTVAIAIGLFFAIVLAIVLYRNVRLAQRTNTILAKNRDEINFQKQELETMGVFKDRLLSVVSHDVKGPLNSLTGMLDLYNQQFLSNEDVATLMGQISVKVKQITIFVNDLLLWARTQMVGAQIVTSMFELQLTIKQTVELLRPIADSKKVNLIVDLQEPITIKADEQMIKIVIRNLVSNAIKFCNANDKVVVSMDVRASEKRVIVSVRDSGVGIPTEKITKLFTSPEVSSQGTEYEIGTGLGLLLSKQYIELNQGTIGVESELDKGSHFWFSMPLEDR